MVRTGWPPCTLTEPRVGRRGRRHRLPRSLDWLVNTTIRGTQEVADGEHFRALPDPDTTAAATVRPEPLAAYADAVHEAADAWLGTLTAEDLDRTVPEFRERQMHLGELEVLIQQATRAIAH